MLFTAWELLGLLQRPEPQGAPVVHRQLEPQPGIGVGDPLAGHFLALDAVFEAERFPGQPSTAVRVCLGITPHRQRVGGALADLGQLVGPLLHQAIGDFSFEAIKAFNPVDIHLSGPSRRPNIGHYNG